MGRLLVEVRSVLFAVMYLLLEPGSTARRKTPFLGALGWSRVRLDGSSLLERRGRRMLRALDACLPEAVAVPFAKHAD